MRVRLLGPVDVLRDGTPRPVSGLRRKAVLAALALHAGEVVGIDRLIDIVWGDHPPSAAGQTVQSHVSHLRGVLGDRSAITAQAPGYVLHPGGRDDDVTDVQAAERLIRLGSDTTDPGAAATRLHEAVDLWRGRPLADVTGLPWFDEQSRRLQQLHGQARHALIDARLRLGEHTELIPELRGLVQLDPHHEQTHAQLMLALYRAGRQTEALAVYQQLRRALDEDLGISPGPALRDLETAILRRDRAVDLPPPVFVPGAPAAATSAGPAQLPLAPPVFTGRAEELARLDGLLGGTEGSGPAAAVVISAVSGTAGIGKTALAVHWAHRVADRFPDGQLYVNLRGFDPGGAALNPADALRGFLDAFAVPASRIPAEPSAQAALYRTILAGKRVLVVLDNARDAEQVRPLLPGTPGCLAIVTSRNQLSGLVAIEAAHPLTLGLLSAADARGLLARRLGTGRVSTEPGAVDDIIARCARLPLALAIAAARAATQPTFPLTALAAELHDAGNSLDVLHSGDPASDIRAVFSWSLRALSPDAGALFRLLALQPGPDISAAAVAGLAGRPAQRVHQLLTELAQAHLITEHTRGRYAFHDLLRAYATEQSRGLDDEPTRSAAIRRVLDHYLHTAYAAAVLLHPQREPITLAAPLPGVVPEPLTDSAAALAWFTAEHPVLLAAVELAAATGHDTHTWQLAWAFTTYLLRQGHWPEHVAMQDIALSAARRLGDRAGQADILHGLARSYARLGAYDDARTHFQHALDVYTGLGDHAGQAHNHMGLAEVAEQQGRYADTLRHNEEAVALFRAAGDRDGEANALNGIGWSHLLLDDFPEALVSCRQALDLLLELDDLDGQAATWDSLGCIHRGLGDYEQAIACHHRSVELCRDIGDRFWEADSLKSLGDTHHAAGDPAAARRAWQEALTILDELDHQKADELRTKLPPTDPTADL